MASDYSNNLVVLDGTFKEKFEINSNQMTVNSLSFPFDRLGDDSLCLCNLWGNCRMTSGRKIIVPWDTTDSFGLLRELLYSNETFVENVMATETNTAIPILNLDFHIENKHKC